MPDNTPSPLQTILEQLALDAQEAINDIQDELKLLTNQLEQEQK